MQKRWIISAPHPDAPAMAREMGISPTLAQILLQRGHTTADTARTFLRPRLQDLTDPLSLPDMPDAVSRIQHALDHRQRIVIYGDYDVDGVTSCAFLIRTLRALGAAPDLVRSFLPNRMDEGYGLSADGLARCLADHEPRLLLAVDCGTSSAVEIADTQQRGVDVIVLDHHHVPPQLPDCPVVNPKRLDSNPPWKELCSAGLAFKLAHALLKSKNLKSQILDLKSHLDLVALGTIADIVPLTGENRILSRAGLVSLGKTEKIGLQKLMEKAQVPRGDSVEPAHVGFRLGPRLNAAGRLGDAAAALELLLTDDTQRAEELATFLDTNNHHRQQTEQQVVEEAHQMLEHFDPDRDRVIVLAGESWHIGVVGIVASRLMREFYRPTFIIGQDKDGLGRGSCRSIHGFDIVHALGHCAPLLERFGGHSMAAGFSIRMDRVATFRQHLNTVAAERLTDQDLLPRLTLDATITLGDINETLLADLQQLEPCGQSNPSPLLCAQDLHVQSLQTIGADGKHLKLRLADETGTHPAIGFGLGHLAAELRPLLSALRVDAAFIPEWNTYRGAREIQLHLKDLRRTPRLP